MSFLSDREIREAVQKGFVRIRGFDPDGHLQSSSYDVTLGFFYYRAVAPALQPNPSTESAVRANVQSAFYNPYRTGEDGAAKNWGSYQRAGSVKDLVASGLVLDDGCGLDPDKDRGLLLRPGETIIANTQEFFGALLPYAAQLSSHRDLLLNGITVSSIGWGNSGYVDRWPLLIANVGRHNVLLVCGKKIATVAFFCGSSSPDIFGSGVAAPTDFDMDVVGSDWKPSKLLPTTGTAPPTTTTPRKRATGGAAPDQRKAEVQQEIEVQQRQRKVRPPKKSLRLPEPERDAEGNPVLPTGLHSIDTKEDRGVYVAPEVLEYDPLKI